jgi:GDP/UDP-N,N'-diacetylbacillosamine 2-epimerase (hydrolysing)
MLEFISSNNFEFQLIVTGSHLSYQHGYTIKEILSDGIKVDQKVRIINKTDVPIDIANIFGNTVTKMTKPLSRLKPDVLLLLGDRYEIFAAAISATILKIPIAHIHGGEITEGAMDNVMRHCLTKLSHIHFASNIVYKKRIIQMGELPQNVHNVGALGVENTKKLKFVTLEELEQNLNFKFYNKNILISYHSVTLDENPIHGIEVILKVLKKFKNVGLIFTYANADIKGTIINNEIIKFVKKNKNAVVFSNLGQLKYLSCLKYCDGIIGNSSSAIIEAPSVNTWSINIGNRQKGRIKSKSVFDEEIHLNSIEKTLQSLLKTENNDNTINYVNPYEKSNTKNSILDILVKTDIKKIIAKKFFDINYIISKS